MPASVLTQHNDPGRSGHNPAETLLDASNVSGDTFGRLFDLPVNGPVSAQPLVVAGVKMGSRRRNLLIVATMHNAVYAFDADAPAPGPPLWQADLGGIRSVPTSAFGRDYNDMQHRNVGVLGTPVADPETATLYLVAMTWDPARFNREPQDAFSHLLFALDLATGKPRLPSGGRRTPARSQAPSTAAAIWRPTASRPPGATATASCSTTGSRPTASPRRRAPRSTRT